jgi:hypothetical protein
LRAKRLTNNNSPFKTTYSPSWPGPYLPLRYVKKGFWVYNDDLERTGKEAYFEALSEQLLEESEENPQ